MFDGDGSRGLADDTELVSEEERDLPGDVPDEAEAEEDEDDDPASDEPTNVFGTRSCSSQQLVPLESLVTPLPDTDRTRARRSDCQKVLVPVAKKNSSRRQQGASDMSMVAQAPAPNQGLATQQNWRCIICALTAPQAFNSIDGADSNDRNYHRRRRQASGGAFDSDCCKKLHCFGKPEPGELVSGGGSDDTVGQR